MADTGWDREFDDPVPLPGGGELITLRDAGDYISQLPPAEHELERWWTAIEVLMQVVQRGWPTMFARIGVMRALDPVDPVAPIEPRRKPAKKYKIISGNLGTKKGPGAPKRNRGKV